MSKVELGKHQRAYFDGLTREEIQDHVRKFESEIGALAAAPSPAATERTAQLQARVEYLRKRLHP